MSEWLKEPVLKTGMLAKVSGVRILPHPFDCLVIRLYFFVKQKNKTHKKIQQTNKYNKQNIFVFLIGKRKKKRKNINKIQKKWLSTFQFLFIL